MPEDSDKQFPQDDNPDKVFDSNDANNDSARIDENIFSPALKKRIEQAKSKSVDQFLQSIKPQDQGKKRRYVLVGTIVSAVIVVLGGAWAAFALWYQNPDNAVTGAIAKSLTAKTMGASGTMVYGGQIGGKFEITYGYKEGLKSKGEIGIGTDESGQSVVVKTDVVGESDGDMYFKIENLDELIGTFIQQSALAFRMLGVPDTEIQSQQKKLVSVFDPVVKNLDERWVMFGASEIRRFNKESAREYECIFNALEDIGSNPARLTDVGVAYFNNRVISVKESLGVKDGNSGYVIDINQDATKRFANALRETQFFKDLNKCSNGTIAAEDLDTSKVGKSGSSSKLRTEVWIDYWTHQLKQIKISDSKGLIEMDMKFTFDKPLDVTIPKDFVQYGDVAQEMNSLLVLTLYNPITSSNR